MTLLALIVRELRSQARQPLTHWLRVLAAGALILTFWLVTLKLSSWERNLIAAGFAGPRGGNIAFGSWGPLLFGYLNGALLLCNIFLAPLLTADCISREKREGTLGLLFLTKLTAAGIVSGKGFVHALRGVILFTAALPILTVPVLAGGISAKDCGMALLIDVTVLLLGLTAGIIASTVSRDWMRSAILAELLSVAFVLAFMCAHALSAITFLSASGFPSFRRFHLEELAEVVCFHINLAELSSAWGGTIVTTWSDLWARPNLTGEWFTLMAFCLAMAVAVFALSIAVAAWQVRRSWRQEPASARVSERQQVWTRPRFGVNFLRRRLSRSMNRNPIGWLQHYSWSGRLTKWGWFAALALAELYALSDLRNFFDAQPLLMLVLLVGMAFAASASFRKERESGALELLLVCPLSVRQLAMGRLAGIWTQFLPSLALLALCIITGVQVESRDDALPGVELLFFGLACVSVSVIGLFFSLHTANFFTGWFLTMACGLGFPMLMLVERSWWFAPEHHAELVVLFFHLLATLIFMAMLHDSLAQRRFRFSKT